MLTRELAIATFENGELVPDRLSRKSDAAYIGFADKMLAIYRNGIGLTRRSLHQAVHRVFNEQVDCPGRRIQAFCPQRAERACGRIFRHGHGLSLHVARGAGQERETNSID